MTEVEGPLNCHFLVGWGGGGGEGPVIMINRKELNCGHVVMMACSFIQGPPKWF